MKLDDCVANYIEYKRGLGMRFITEDRILRAFCRAVGDASTASVSTDQVLRFLLVNGERTRFWEIKYSVLKGFYSFAIAHGYAQRVPLPPTMKRQPQALVPYIYTRQELSSLFAVAAGPFPRQARMEPYVLRTLLVLLYGAGLRISEALLLKLDDVDLEQALICVRDTKFYNYADFLAMPIRQGLDRDDACKEPAGRHSQVAWIGIVLMAKDPRNVASLLSGRFGFAFLSRGFNIRENVPPLRPSQKRA